MATQRVSRLQKQMLRWLLTDHHRTRGVLASSHEELVKALGSDKGNISHSLRTLAGRDDHWAFVWWENRIPAAHSRGTEMGLAVCGKL